MKCVTTNLSKFQRFSAVPLGGFILVPSPPVVPEVYRAALYVSEAYYAFLEEIDMLEGIYMRSWMEQAFKTLWMAIVTPPDAWRRYACELPTLHRGTRETWFDYVGCAA